MFLRILLSILIGLLFGMLCSNLAQRRRKNTFLWFQLGFFFGLLGVLFFCISLLFDRWKSRSQPAKEGALISKTSLSKEEVPQQAHIPQTIITLEEREWFYLDQKNEKQGGISFKDLKKLTQEKVIKETTLLWSEGMDNWKKFSDLAYLKLVLELES